MLAIETIEMHSQHHFMTKFDAVKLSAYLKVSAVHAIPKKALNFNFS